MYREVDDYVSNCCSCAKAEDIKLHQYIIDPFKFIYSALGVRQLPITAHHAQSNGQTERYNQTLEHRLMHYVTDIKPTEIALVNL